MICSSKDSVIGEHLLWVLLSVNDRHRRYAQKMPKLTKMLTKKKEYECACLPKMMQKPMIEPILLINYEAYTFLPHTHLVEWSFNITVHKELDLQKIWHGIFCDKLFVSF